MNEFGIQAMEGGPHSLVYYFSLQLVRNGQELTLDMTGKK